MIRALLIIVLVLALGAATDGPATVPATTERDHLVGLLQHVCHRTSRLPDELEGCQQVGLRAIDRLASTSERVRP